MKNKKYCFQTISIILLLLICLKTNAQQIVYSQDFEDPISATDWNLNANVPFLGTVITSDINEFVINDNYDGGQVDFQGIGFPIVVNPTADQTPLTGLPNSNYLHTAAKVALEGNPAFGIAPTLSSSYIDAGWGVNQELICVETDDFDLSEHEGVGIEFNWYSSPSDYIGLGTVVYYSIDQGVTWQIVGNPLASNYLWQNEVYTAADFNNILDNQQFVRFAFVFNNGLDNVFDGNQPLMKGFGLDDFKIIADCEFSLPEDYSVCSGESTTIFADTTWMETFTWNYNGNIISVEDSATQVINNDITITVTASNSTGCINLSDDITIFVQTERANLGLIVNGEVNGIGIPCYGDCNGELQLEVINGTPENDGSYTIQWLDSLMNPINNNVNNSVLNNFTSTLSDICEGKYYVSVLDAICTIPEMDSITIISNDSITNTFTSDSTSCYNGNDGTTMAHPSGGVAPYTFDWGAFGTQQSITDLPIGTYTVVVTDSVGCSKDFSVEISQPNQLIVDPFISDQISCYGLSDGELSANVYGGTGDYSFVWSHPNYPWVDDASYHLQTLSNLPFSVGADDIALNPNYQSYSDPYKVTVIDDNGCQSESEIYLIEPPKLELFLTQPTKPAYCNNNLLGSNTGWAQVSASGGTSNANDNYNFVWSVLGQTDEDVLYSSIQNMNSGFYDVTVVDSRLCADQLTVEIDLVATWQEFTSSTPASCFGYNDGTVSISMEGGCGDIDNSCNFYYEWNGGAATGNNLPNVDELQQGNYSVTVTDEFGCEGVYTLTVDGPTRVDFQVTDLVNQSCFSSTASSDDGSVTVEVVGGVAPYNISWTDMNTMISNNNQTTNSLSVGGLTSSNWIIQVTDASGCDGIFDLTSLHPNPFFIDNGVEVSAVINTNELFLTDTINCFGSNNAMASVLNSNPSFDYSWHIEGSTEVIDEGSSSNAIPAGNIQVTASYLLGLCKATSTPVTIVERDPFTLNNLSTNPSCLDDNDGSISITVTGATPFLNNDQLEDYNHTWFPNSLNGFGLINENGSLDFNIANQDAGSYYLEVVDRYGCDTVFTIELMNPSVVTADISTSNPDCHNSNGAPNGNITVFASGGTTPYDAYYITSSNSNISGVFNGLAGGNYSVYVEDNNGCISIVSNVILSEPSPLTIDLVSTEGVDCNGDNSGEITVVANGGTQPYANYTITGATSSNNNNGVFANLPAGNYVVAVEDANNCTKTINETVTSPSPLSNPILAVTNPSCFGSSDGSIDLTVTGGTLPYTFDWSNGENSEDVGFLSSGLITVTVTDENDCEVSASHTLIDPAEVVADWIINTPGANGPHYIVSKPAPFTVEFIDVSQNSDVTLNQWWVNGNNTTLNFYEGFSSNSYQYTFTEIGNHEVIFEVTDGTCVDTISLVVSVQGIVEFNAFSPNGDNINDNFSFENYGISDLNAIIYNRWGDKIYEMNSPSDIWNGVSMNGLEVPEGVYFYVLNATGEDGTPYNEKGSVTIYR